MANSWNAAGDGAAAGATNKSDSSCPFWDHDKVPNRRSDEFKRLVFRNPDDKSEKGKHHEGQIFTPKSEHCGTWHSPPNPECYSSFGDQGTTASVNCYGHMIQMTRFLGAGHSGMFSMDHDGTDQPYRVLTRMSNLRALSQDNGDLLRYGLCLPREFLPKKPVKVKWVNWKWPRYEYDTQVTDVRACSQWLVHKGAVLQQFVLENSGQQSVNFKYRFTKRILVRDLDHLDPFYPFNWVLEKHSRIPGPNGYGHVCVHKLNHNANVNARAATASAEKDTNLGRNLDEHTKSPGSVAIIVNLFVNGRAAVMGDDDTWHEHTVGGRLSVSGGTTSGKFEITVLYKMILIPDGHVDWRNFLVGTQDADVSKILRAETECLWESAGTQSLCSLGLSCVEPNGGASLSPEHADAKYDGLEKTSDGHSDAGSGPPEANVVVSEGSERTLLPKNVDSHMNTPSTARHDPSSESMGDSLPSGTLKPGSSPKSHIEYFAWRHLEHILSVCAVPILLPKLIEDHSTQQPGHSRGSPPASWEAEAKTDDALVALTCGDMSGHLIGASASFFAFKFLVEVAKRLACIPSQIPYTRILQQRIQHVLRGHVSWLESLRTMNGPPAAGTRKKLLQSGCFAPRYWVTGEIARRRRERWQRSSGVADTPFHVLKLAEYMDYCREFGDNGKEAEEKVCRILRDVKVPWLYELGKSDKRACFAWPHDTDLYGVHKYKLSDHFWIWKTLKAVYDAGARSAQHSTGSEFCGSEQLSEEDEHELWLHYLFTSDAPWYGEGTFLEIFMKVEKRLQPDGAQRGILQRFTTENDVSRKKMLAVTRSPRETRFLFHARDTALFYAQDCGFFLPESPFEELWSNTIEAQIHHTENDDTGWSNTIRYALGIMVGCRDLTLNKRSPNDLVRTCIESLIHSSSHSAFFSHRLDETTNEPLPFCNESTVDLYYHAGFEINYILLTHARIIDQYFEATLATSSQRPMSASMMPKIDRENQPNCNLPSRGGETSSGTTVQPRAQTRPENTFAARKVEPARHFEGQQSMTMKKIMSFHSLIDATNIVSIDEEWLYPYPNIFSTRKTDIQNQINHLLDVRQSRLNRKLHSIFGSSNNSSECVIGQGFELHCGRSGTSSESLEPMAYDAAAFVIDRPKRKNTFQEDPIESFNLTNWKLLSRLGAPRTAENAKKRFLWLPHANAETALICWAAVPEEDRTSISQFFDSHSKYEKRFGEYTELLLNTWETELHLSFYVLVDVASPHHAGLPPLNRDLFPGGSQQEICRASMSFCFDGDLFDRYWTCHYVEYVPSKPRQVKWRFPFDSCTNYHKRFWQRKVLELFLLDDILREVADGAVKILTQVRKELGVGESTLLLSNFDIETYSSRENWHRFEMVLGAVEEDLNSTLDTLGKWTSREQDRGSQQPRWTRDDERKYRNEINKHRGWTQQSIKCLEVHRDSIRKLKNDLATSRQKIRDDRELRRNENIRYFTYVTIIFLPLGFAASFYSMNGPPESELLVSLIKFAAGALVVTVGLLASAKTVFLAVDFLAVPLRQMRSKAGFAIEDFSKSTMEQSLLLKKYEELGRRDGQERAAPLSPSWGVPSGQQHISQRDEILVSPSPYCFWMAYIFIEIPARRILVSISELRDGSPSPQALAKILVGIALMPVFGLSWLMKIIFLNIQDLVQLLEQAGRLFPKPLANSGPKNKDDDAAALLRQFQRMTNPPGATRPLKILQEKLRREPELDTIAQQPK